MCDIRECPKKGKHKVAVATRGNDLKSIVNLCSEHYAALHGDGVAYSMGSHVEEAHVLPYVIYDRKELSIIISLLEDIHGRDHLKKVPELDYSSLENDFEDINVLNKKLWKLLGNGLEMHLLVMTPLHEIPLLINTYTDTKFERMIKLRLELGK